MIFVDKDQLRFFDVSIFKNESEKYIKLWKRKYKINIIKDISFNQKLINFIENNNF